MLANSSEDPTTTLSRDEFEELVRRANEGKAGSLDELRATLDENPQIWQQVGDLGMHAEMMLARRVAGEDTLLYESVLRKAQELRQELGWEGASPLEQLAVQRVVACWLELQWTQTEFPEPKGASLPQARFTLQVKESAQRRFEAAIRSLSLVRKMVPAGAGRDEDEEPSATVARIFAA